MNTRIYCAVILAFAAQSAIAGGLGRPVTYESSGAWESRFDFPCANEPLRIEYHATSRSHEFQTSTGTYHWLESVTVVSLAEGVITGRKWVGQTHQSFKDVFKLGTGETFGFSFREVYRPVEGDGPMFAVYNQYVVRLDGDGNLITENEKGYSVDGKCLGSAK